MLCDEHDFFPERIDADSKSSPAREVEQKQKS